MMIDTDTLKMLCLIGIVLYVLYSSVAQAGKPRKRLRPRKEEYIDL